MKIGRSIDFLVVHYAKSWRCAGNIERRRLSEGRAGPGTPLRRKPGPGDAPSKNSALQQDGKATSTKRWHTGRAQATPSMAPFWAVNKEALASFFIGAMCSSKVMSTNSWNEMVPLPSVSYLSKKAFITASSTCS